MLRYMSPMRPRLPLLMAGNPACLMRPRLRVQNLGTLKSGTTCSMVPSLTMLPLTLCLQTNCLAATTAQSRMVDALQTLGVNAVDATRYAMNIVRCARTAAADSRPTFVEVYGTGNSMRLANDRMRNLNLEGLSALDLRTCKPSGEPWNFNRR